MGFRMAGKSNKGAMRLLSLRGQVWWFRRNIPAACRASLGVTAWLRSLETSDIRVAKVRRDELEQETTRLFADIQSGRPIAPESASPALRGNLWREAMTALSEEVDANDDDGEGSEELDLARHAQDAEREALRATDKRAFDDARLPKGHA